MMGARGTIRLFPSFLWSLLDAGRATPDIGGIEAVMSATSQE
jgi:hypothetical protein